MNKILSMIQSELIAPKGQMNSFGNYRYRSCEDILEAVKPLLKKHNATIAMTDEIVHVGDRYYIKAVVTFVSDDGEVKSEALAREAELKKGMDVAQITGAASSYARKYALSGLFCIDDTKEADASNDNEPVAVVAYMTEQQKLNLMNLIDSKGIAVETVCKAYGIKSIDLLPLDKLAAVEARLSKRADKI